jgi:tetratricopeptide (TPR) repeat protein
MWRLDWKWIAILGLLASADGSARSLLADKVPDPFNTWIMHLPPWVPLLLVAALLVAKFWGQLRKLRLFLFNRPKYESDKPATAGKIDDAAAHLESKFDDLQAMILERVGEPRLHNAAPLTADAQARQEEAARDLAADQSPSARDAINDLARHDLPAAIAALKAGAQSDTIAAADKWRRLGDLVMGVDTAESLNAYEQAFKLQPDHFGTCIYLARLRIEAGNLAGAQAAVATAERLVTCDRERMAIDLEAGDLLTQLGNLADPATHYRQATTAVEHHLRTSPDDLIAQRDLSVCWERMGNSARDQGDLVAARDAVQKCLDIRLHLAEVTPTSAQAQRDLLVCYSRLGEVMLLQRDLIASGDAFQRALDIAKQLAEANPTSAEAQHDLAVSHECLGVVSEAQDDKAAAIRHFEAERDIIAPWVARFPDHPGLKGVLDVAERELAKLR